VFLLGAEALETRLWSLADVTLNKCLIEQSRGQY
jgi:hypothetical protein